mmetsp:Transcript_20620/g.29535  ORF Transcript_20620/g.29535 Transcript_20620/m.29535 type:complete len:112 (+) Transcript_20620:76-411(+)
MMNFIERLQWMDCTPKNHDEIHGNSKQWKVEVINVYNEEIFSHCGAYENLACIQAAEDYEYIKDKVGIVLGSQIPWAENGLIHYGANHVITVEYMKIVSGHPKLSTMLLRS